MADKKKSRKGVGGRPTKYNAKTHPVQAEKLMAKHGYTMEELADFFVIAESTLYEWQEKYPDFRESIKKGRDAFDTDQVENALLQTALGIEYNETTVEQYIDKAGKPQTKKKVVKKFIGGNPIAQKFWLQNRNPERWREKQEISLPDGEHLVPFTAIIAKVDKNDE